MHALIAPRHRRIVTLLPLASACLIQSWAAPCFAELPPAPAAEVQPSPDARQEFQLGVSLLQDPDGARYEDAFKSFMRAYQLSPAWQILSNLGLSALKLERYTEGIEAYERYLAEGRENIDSTERAQIERDLAVMRGTSGTVTLIVTGANSVSLEDTRTRSVGGPIVNTYEVPAGGRIVLKLAAGKHSLIASGEGKTASLELKVEAASNVEHALELREGEASSAPATATSSTTSTGTVESADTSPSTLRTTGLIVGGVGVAALIGGGITGFIGLGKKSDLDERCPNDECRYTSPTEKASIDSDKDSLRTIGTLTTALLVGGGVLTATGVTLYIVGGPTESERVSVAPSFAPGVAGFSAQGAF